MKHLYLCLVMVGLALGARAQTTYAHLPLFRFGFTYQYTEAGTSGDTTHTMRMAWPHINYPDSVARLNGRVVRLTRSTPGCGGASQALRPDGLFGATVVIGYRNASTSEYTLRAYNGRTFVFKPGAALNQPWTATTTGLTAQVTARGATTTFGQPDVVATITLSDGETIRYSQQWGYLEGPNLGAYLNGQRRRHLVLTAITGRGLSLGQRAVGNTTMFDYQPGDVFVRYGKQEGTSTTALCSESWTRDSVLTRYVSSNGDTMRYLIRSRTLTRVYGSPSAPLGFCRNTPGTVLGPYTTYSAVITPDAPTLLASLTHTLDVNSATLSTRMLTLAGYRTADFRGRKTQGMVLRSVCLPTSADSALLAEIVDNSATYTYAAGLGEVASCRMGLVYSSYTSLLGYRKVNLPTSTGVETWGSLPGFSAILKAAEHRPAPTTAAFPNPFGGELTVRFEAGRAQTVTATLYNALGQRVQQQQLAVTAGAAQLQLALPALPAGLYTLHLQHDGRTEVLKLTAAQ